LALALAAPFGRQSPGGAVENSLDLCADLGRQWCRWARLHITARLLDRRSARAGPSRRTDRATEPPQRVIAAPLAGDAERERQ
jgi:hypothetical protein